jgi:integrase
MKEYKGRKYAVSCRQLGTPETKEASYRQANAWWQRTKAQVDGYTPVVPRAGSPEVLGRLVEAWAGQPLTTEVDALAALADMMAHFQNQPLPTVVAQTVLGPAEVARLEAQTQAVLEAPAATPDTSVAAHAALWHQHQQALVAAGQMSPDRAANNRTCLAHFLTFAGHEDVAGVNAAKVEGFYLYCAGRVAQRRKGEAGWSVAYSRDVFSVARTFIRWLAEHDYCPLPKNISSRSFRFGSPAQVIKTWTVEEFRRALDGSPEKLRLCLLLMANCGMTQWDVSELPDTEVDWANGRVIRKRSKTAACDSAPAVNYKLWDSTFTLLQKFRSGNEKVLATRCGQQYVRKDMRDGQLCKTDAWGVYWYRVRKRLGILRPLKQLRKLGSSLLDNHPAYGRFTQHWLGHSPRTVSTRHYTTPSQELFDEAVAWLGEQLGQSRAVEPA